MKILLLGVSLLALAAAVRAGDKPVAWNRADKPPSRLDAQLTAALASHFTVADVPDGAVYVSPQATAGSLPTRAKTESGEVLSGYVLVAYVITIEGRATAPSIIETTEPRLESFVVEALRDWRFTPGSIDGEAVAIASAQEFDFVSDVHTAPTEFVMQVLEPAGGKVERPRDWFYAEGGDAHSFVWTLSRERAVRGYETGMRIQLISGVQRNLDKSPRQFLLDFLADKQKQEGVKVLTSFDETPMGLFTRKGLETEEGDAHIVYSVFWPSGGGDIAVVTIAGTRTDLWSTYAPAFERMGRFELIDMARFDK
jgi:hypothetical protein